MQQADKHTGGLLAAARAALNTIEVMEEGVALIDMDGTVLSVNPALVRLSEYPKEQLEGTHVADLFPRLLDAADVPWILHVLESALLDKMPKLREMTMISKTANRISVIPRTTFIRDHANKPVTIVLTLQDITEHKKAKRQNQIVTTLLALFAKKTSRTGYLDAVTRVVHQWSGCRCLGIRVVNGNKEVPYESYVGFSKEFVESENALKIDTDQCACTRIMAGRPGPQDLPCLTPNGSFQCQNTFYFVESLSETEKGQFRGVCIKAGFASLAIIPVKYRDVIVGAIHLADEKVRMVSAENIAFAESTLAPIIGEAIHRFDVEQVLRHVGTYNRSLIEASPDPLVTINEQGEITDVNTATEKVTGYGRNDLIGTDFSDYFSDPVLARAGYQQVFKDGVVRDYALDIRHLDGHLTPVLYNASVYRDKAGHIVGVFAAARDITEQKKAQQKLDDYQADLRALSLNLTLAEERARRQLAIGLHDTVGQTLALTKIKLGLLGHLIVAKESRQALAEIKEMFDEAVRQTRTLSFELSPPILYELGLGAAIEWLGEDFAKRYGFQVYCEGTGQACEIDEPMRVLFFQSARELLTNITKHAEATEVHMALETDNGRVMMTISDNGKGLDPKTTADAFAGKNSLGLFSIRERMKQIGGAFEISAQQGPGIKVILTAHMQNPISMATDTGG